MLKKIDKYQENLNQNKEAPDSWCVIPWSHVSIKGNGTYRLCCQSGSSQNFGILRDEKKQPFYIGKADWEQVINSDIMKSVRKNMLQGKWSKECIRCEREHNSGMKSRNIYERFTLATVVEPENYPGYIKTKALTKPDGSISLSDFPISSFYIRFSNLCNLKCVMCSPPDSNQWYEDFSTLWGGGERYFFEGENKVSLISDSKGKLKTKENIYEWSNNSHLWSQIEKNLENFRYVFISGGEPFLIKEYYDFLQKCIERDLSSKLIIECSSNITSIPAKAFTLWKHFKLILIGISLDGVGAVNNFIRYPSKWDTIEKNLLMLNETGENVELHVNTTVSLLNIFEFPKLIEYIMKNNFKKIGPWKKDLFMKVPLINPHPLHRPEYLNVNILEENFKEKIKKHFNCFKDEISAFDWQAAYGESRGGSWNKKIDHACRILDNYHEFMYKIKYNKTELDRLRKQFIYFMDKLDNLRGTCWQKVLPELYEHTMKWRKIS